MDEVEEIKSRLDIVTVIGEYIKLTKAGQNWKGLCPFHNEKTPSFLVNQDRQFYYCFGCSQGGDIFTFLQRMENLEFPEALRILAKKSGVVLTGYDERAASQKTRLLDLLSLSARYWQKLLVGPSGKSALDYLKKRGLSDKTMEDFKIGYAADSWDNLNRFLKGQGYQETEIFQAGLSVKKDQGSGYYDRFRDRVMFPIQDLYGNVVGFTGRALKSTETAKYVNTPESPTYHKGKILYALDKAKQEIKKQNYAVIVEGNMDAIASHQAGVINVAAVSGTALTPEQIALLKRFTSNVILCFDMDEAGQKAASRSIDLLLENEMNIKIVQLSFGKDPDECIKNNPKNWLKALKESKNYLAYEFEKVFNKYDLSKATDKKNAAKELLTQIQKITNPIEKDHWLKILAQKLDVSDSLLREALPKVTKINKPSLIAMKPTDKEDRATAKCKLFISLIINYPANLEYVINNLSPEMLELEYGKLYNSIVNWYNFSSSKDKQSLSDYLFNQKEFNQDKNYLNSLYLLVEKELDNVSPQNRQQEIVHLVSEFSKKYIEKKIKQIGEQIAEHEKQKNKAKVDELTRELQELIYKKNKLS